MFEWNFKLFLWVRMLNLIFNPSQRNENEKVENDFLFDEESEWLDSAPKKK